MPTLALNKKGLYDYAVLEKFEAGIALSGAEVKSAKAGHLKLTGSYVSIQGNNAYLKGAHISPYKPAAAHQTDYVPVQERKLLLNKKELDYLRGKTQEKGLTILPISVYTKGSLVKVEIGVVKGKKKHDKRETLKKRAIDKKIRNAIKYT